MATKQYTYSQGPNHIMAFLKGRPYSVQKTHPNYAKIVTKVLKGYKKDKQIDKLINLFDTKAAVKSYCGDQINISDSGVLTFEGSIIDNVLTHKIIRMMDEGINIEPMVNFLINLRSNPSDTSQQELMLFLEENELPITPDGYFLAYKSVNSNYRDVHSGTFDNSIGAVCEMPRSKVNHDRTQTCSSGLHFASLAYAGSFATNGHLMVLKIHPADVVSIPNDYNNEKGRCCKYTVIDEVPMRTKGEDQFNSVAVYDDSDEDDYDECPFCGILLDDEDITNGYCPNCGEIL